MLLRSSEKKLTKKGRYIRVALLALGIPLFLLAVFALEAINNPSLLSRKYLMAEYGPTVLWPVYHGYNAFEQNEPFVKSAIDAVSNKFRGLDPNLPAVPDLVLDVKFKEMSKIYQERDAALRAGRLIQSDDSFVKGKIRETSGNVPVKLRLKGDWTDHLEGRKWSFRIHTRKGEQYYGMRRFSVQHPKVRGYHAEVLYFDMLREYGVLAPRVMLVNMMLNGEDLGIMSIEEHFAKELLESQSRREGIIVRFDESLLWRSPDGNIRHIDGSYDDYHNATVDTFESGNVLESPVFSKHYAAATGLLRGFVEGRLRASDVFDASTLGAFLAISEAFGAHHALRWHNQRFYVNPITLKLEPIAFDANLPRRETENKSVIQNEPITAAMLRDPLVMARFREVLGKLAIEAESGELLDKLIASEQRFYDVLKTEYIFLPPYPATEVPARTLALLDAPDEFFTAPRTREIVGVVEPELYPLPAHVYRVRDGDDEFLEIKNAIPYEIQVTGIAPAGVGAEPPVIPLNGLPTTLAPREFESVGEMKRIKLPQNMHDSNWLVLVTAGERNFSLPVIPYYPAVDGPAIPVGKLEDILSANSFLELNRADNSVSAKPGVWDVPELISLPPGYSLRLEPGTELRFGADAGLVVRGQVFFAGSAEQPVRLVPVAGAESWLGIAIMEAGGLSEWRNVDIVGTRGVAIGPWLLMGGTNFYRSPVTIERTSIRHHKGEDGLNIISSNFTVRDLEIEDTLSDGFDCDFCTGEVFGGRFTQIGTAGGGDAIDVSLSEISVVGTEFSDVSDKAISIGERSRATASGLRVTDSGTGAAAKDGSFLLLENSEISGAKVAALMAYIKKPEFGAAELIARDLKLTDNRTAAVAQTGSRIEIDGVPVQAEDVDVDVMYDTIMRPGLRRPQAETESEQNDAGT